MNKYIIRGSAASWMIVGNILYLYYNAALDDILTHLSIFVVGVFSFEFIICLICYHHALWNQDQSKQESQDGTK